MNIIWLCPESPYPPETGGKIVLYERLSYARKLGHKIWLFVADNHGFTDLEIVQLRQICTKVVTYCVEKKAITLLRSFVVGIPYCVLSKTSEKFVSEICRLIYDSNIDLILCEFPYMLNNLPKSCSGIPLVVEQQNVEWKSLGSVAKAYPRYALRRLFYSFESVRLKRYEERAYRALPISRMGFLTEEDACDPSYPKSMNKVVTMPGGLDVSSEFKSEINNSPKITFVANYSYEPNVHAAKWLINKVAPVVLKSIPAAQFVLAGRGDLSDFIGSDREHVVVTGPVSDIREIYEEADVVCVPVSKGGGIKMKLLEATSSNRPIVTNSFSTIGTGLCDGKHVLIRDEPESFAAGIVEILENYSDYEEMCQRAHKKYEEDFSWDASNRIWFNRLICPAVNSCSQRN